VADLQLFGKPVNAGPVSGGNLENIGDECEESGPGHILIEKRFIRHIPNAAFRLQRVGQHIDTRNPDGPAVRTQEPGEDLDGGGLAGAVGPKEPEQLALPNLQREIIKGATFALCVALDQALYRYHSALPGSALNLLTASNNGLISSGAKR